jgi:hypothetical protein
MEYIKEPDGVDFFVDARALTESDNKKISEAIAYYKATGRKMAVKNFSSKPLLVKIKKRMAV